MREGTEAVNNVMTAWHICWPLFETCHVPRVQVGPKITSTATFLLFIIFPMLGTLPCYVTNMFVATWSGVSLMRMASGYAVLVRPVFFLSPHVITVSW